MALRFFRRNRAPTTYSQSRQQVLEPEQFLKLTPHQRGLIAHSRIVGPSPGHRFGGIMVVWKPEANPYPTACAAHG